MEIEKKAELKISAKAAYDLFLEVVWPQGGGLGRPEWTKIIEKGDPVTRIGQVRRVPGGDKEKIMNTIDGTRVEYQVVQGSLIFKDHWGIVDFVDQSTASEKKCFVKWQVKCRGMFGMGTAVKFMIDVALTRMLAALIMASHALEE